ncbi:beta-N-acetylhexosaminidase family protein [Coprobacter tertius]|uniref:Beta-N-acetylglucosaminidase domain-containing protein n=1 Tax=Coprobacter tertius TaxID=2944915 RepID=A0ABT1MF45_9BACT|nr:beta-N-acetylglucosaminidase domain-containing protein [Coprobacter tertius]MCP9610496.1 beta-N-acetylglucosaminidase domain-containing protein [Coprobacter tertius]
MKTKIFIFLLCSTFLSELHAAGYTIYPIPQKMTTEITEITLTRKINVIVEDGVRNITIERLKEVFAKAGYKLLINPAKSTSQTQSNLWIGINGSEGPADKATSISRSVFTPGNNKFDPYILQIKNTLPKGKIVILGNNEGSAFYAMASLEQILEQAKGGPLKETSIEDFAYMQYRGIVEGFYGYPYTMACRLSLLEYCKRYKMNLYVYGPKGDPYHLGYWRRDYPTSLTPAEKENNMITQDDLRILGEKALACNINFVWAAHPAMQDSIRFSSQLLMNPGIDAIMQKFDHLYNLGIRGFGVFIDDIAYTPQGSMQAYLADQVEKKLASHYNTSDSRPEDRVSPLFFVPTTYALNYGNSYTLRDLKNVDTRTVIAFTGYDCFSNIRGSACTDMAERINRNPLMWWNNPVNDDHDDRLYMRKLTTHWKIEDKQPISSLLGLILNPMAQGQASKIALFGGADYAWNPAAFNDNTNWEYAIASISGGNTKIKDALRTFALNADAF